MVKEPSVEPYIGIKVGEGDKPRFLTVAADKEFLDKVREIQEQVKAVKEKKLDLDALEKSLEKLEAELEAGERKLRQVVLKPAKEPGEFTFAKRILEDKDPGDVGVYVRARDKSDKAWTMTAFLAEDDAAIQLSLEGKASQDVYERVVARIKKDLPEGYRLDPEYDEESGTMTFKITPTEGKKDHKGLIKKLVEGLKEEIKK